MAVQAICDVVASIVTETTAPFTSVLRVEVTYHVALPLERELLWTLSYVGATTTLLDEQRTGVLAVGACRVDLEAAERSWRAVPGADVLGEHTLTLTCSYDGQECLRWAWDVRTAADAAPERVTRRLAEARPELVLSRCVYDDSSVRAATAARAATQRAARELEREAANAVWRARLTSGKPEDRARLHLLGVSLAQALGASQDDDAALRFLAQLPLDERLKCSALSRRWRRLALAPALYMELRFDDTALPARFTACGEESWSEVLTDLLARAGAALRVLDVRAPDAEWCAMRASQWPIMKADSLLDLLEEAAAAASGAARRGAARRAAQRQLAEVQLAHGAPLVLEQQLKRLLPPKCPHMAHLSCRLYLMLDPSVPGLLRRLPHAGDVSLVLVKNKAGTWRRGDDAPGAILERVCAALGAAPAVTSVEFSYSYPIYMMQCARRPEEWRRGLDGATIAALAAGLQAQGGAHRVRRLDFRVQVLTEAAVDALENLLRSCAGDASAGAAVEEGGVRSALQEVDLRDARGINQPARMRLLAAATSSSVRLQLTDSEA